MIHDPAARGRELARFYLDVSPRLYADLEESGLLATEGTAPAHVRDEWDCFSLYACVRGLVAAGGFNRETAAAIDAMHEAVLERWMADLGSENAFAARKKLIAERYAEYGRIGQEGGASGAETVTARLGLAATTHMMRSEEPDAALAQLVGGLHETMSDGSAEAVRIAEDAKG